MRDKTFRPSTPEQAAWLNAKQLVAAVWESSLSEEEIAMLRQGSEDFVVSNPIDGPRPNKARKPEGFNMYMKVTYHTGQGILQPPVFDAMPGEYTKVFVFYDTRNRRLTLDRGDLGEAFASRMDVFESDPRVKEALYALSYGKPAKTAKYDGQTVIPVRLLPVVRTPAEEGICEIQVVSPQLVAPESVCQILTPEEVRRRVGRDIPRTIANLEGITDAEFGEASGDRVIYDSVVYANGLLQGRQ